MKERKRLGRGLDAILGESDGHGVRPSVVELDLDLLSPNRSQPRQRFDQEKLSQLARSIKASGLVQPIVVRRVDAGYEIVVGERRWRACQMAGLSRIPSIIKDFSDSELLATTLIGRLREALERGGPLARTDRQPGRHGEKLGLELPSAACAARKHQG